MIVREASEKLRSGIKPMNDRQTPKTPMPKGAQGRWEHTNAHEVGHQENGWPCGDIIRLRCDDCGHEWKEELPQ
jgi:hypothetical protein